MKRSTILCIGSVLTLVAIGVACTFPKVTYSVDADVPDATTLDSGVDADVTPDAMVDAIEEIPPPDFPDANPDVFNPCDQDKDGYKAVGCDGGKDCNDFEKRAHPGQDFLTDVPSGPPNGDWNCSGEPAERQYPSVNCGAITNALACTGEGFVADPGCGKGAMYVKCVWSIGCGNADAGSRIQGCR